MFDQGVDGLGLIKNRGILKRNQINSTIVIKIFMDALLNNPFRILGLPTTATDKEIAKRVSDLIIYTEMGNKVSYET